MLKSAIRKNDLVALLQESMTERENGEGALAARFCALLYGDVGYEALAGQRAEDLVGAACSLLRFIGVRGEGEIRVRAYNPERARDGWHSPHSVIELVCRDRPHLVASLSLALQRRDLSVHQVVHPVLRVERDGAGRLLSLERSDGASQAEAVIRFDIDLQDDPGTLDDIAATCRAVVEDVRLAVDDGPHMRRQLADAIGATACTALALGRSGAALDESLDYLRWLRDGRFFLIGYACYNLRTELTGQSILVLDNASRLGILQLERHFPADKKRIALTDRLAALIRNDAPLILTKSTYPSPIVHSGHLDYIGVKRFDAAGQVIGEHRFFGLYSARAYGTEACEVPMLRLKVRRLHACLAADTDSHRRWLLEQILDRYPRDEMLQCAQEDLEDIVGGILQLYDRPQLKLFVRRDVYGRFVTVQVLLPRDGFSSAVRRRVQQLLVEALEGLDSEARVWQLDGLLVGLQVIVHTVDAHRLSIEPDDLEARIRDALQGWEGHMKTSLVATYGDERGGALFTRYGQAFGAGYRADFGPDRALDDIDWLERIGSAGELTARLQKDPACGRLRFSLYGAGEALALSDVLPVLENLGARVLNAHPYALQVLAVPKWLLDLELDGDGLDPEDPQLCTRFQQAFLETCRQRVENDGYNRLVAVAGLDWRDVLVLRAIGRYLAQIGLAFSQTYLHETLVRNPGLAGMLCELFACRFDPAQVSATSEQVVLARIERSLDGVVSLDEDRIVRGFVAVIRASVRTSHYQTDANGDWRETLALKLQPAQIPGIPQPCPLYEIFVYSPRVEGVHLRGGKVARGGLRWSERREDYRTEVLGLLKAQMVKNAVIVPAGSKGGFYCKRLPQSGAAEAIQNEAVDCYRLFIRALLDITDNRVGDIVVPPVQVVRHDGDDPYLVVAADKGTATFSDIANGIAADYGFWLGDAFASGGSNGYDHKKMGITARGAWESVRRLFRELERDCQREAFTTVGIGDMSGDVFGNGMLLSRQTRLIAAFNHQHIFVDPDPDAVSAFGERERLFRLPRSSWADYDAALISPGGGIFSRSAKRIPISAPMRAALGLGEAQTVMTPTELIRAILQAPVDLLWNGGIGTYVKATDESDAAVGDRANDAVRIDAAALRCRIVGEGGNLGLTQRARIEYARSGGLINTDAIDNAGGVDCSDHEVNIKVLLGQAIDAGELDATARNALLVAMQDEVAEQVLSNNRDQAAMLSLAMRTVVTDLPEYRQQVQSLEREGRLEPVLAGVPDAEGFVALETCGEGLSRPEIAVLTAHSKIRLAEALAAESPADHASLSSFLDAYFPQVLGRRFARHLAGHPLRHEILATCCANELVNRLGPLAAERLGDTERGLIEVIQAYLVARDLLDTETSWRDIDALDVKTPDGLQAQLHLQIRAALESAIHRILEAAQDGIQLARLRGRLAALADGLDAFLAPDGLAAIEQDTARLAEQGVAEKLARRIAELPYRLATLDILRIAEACDVTVDRAARVYWQQAKQLEADWLRRSIRDLPGGDIWQRRARATLEAELGRVLCRFSQVQLEQALATDATDGQVVAGQRLASLIDRIRACEAPTLAMLSVAVQEMRRILMPMVLPQV